VVATADIDVPFMHKALARHRKASAGTSTSPLTPGTQQFVTFQSPKGSFKDVLAKELIEGTNNTGMSMRRWVTAVW
jgi:hypothetical protein